MREVSGMTAGTRLHVLRRAAGFRLRPVPPYDFELTVRKPAGWHWFTPYELWDGGTIWSGFWFRLVSGERVPLGVRVCMQGEEIAVAVYAARKPSPPDLEKLRRTMTTALGADEDIRPLYALMDRDPVLGDLANRLHGMHEAWGSDIFPSLTLAVLLQMTSFKRSQAMWDCLIRTFGETVRFDGRNILLWPSEETIARQSEESLAPCRLGYRTKSLLCIARQLVEGFPELEELAKMPPEESKAKLMELYGVGEYSAGFADPHPGFMLDVWSVKIFHRLLFKKPVPPGNARAAIAATTQEAERRWGRWRGYIMTYVLNDLPCLEEKYGITA